MSHLQGKAALPTPLLSFVLKSLAPTEDQALPLFQKKVFKLFIVPVNLSFLLTLYEEIVLHSRQAATDGAHNIF